jgi:hypothetical protein
MPNETQTEGQAVEQNQAGAPATQTQRGAQVKLPDGTQMPIRDYVVKRFHETGGDRGQIAFELSKTYQYVYNMTKGPEFQNVNGQARNRNAVIEVVPGAPRPAGERSQRKQGGGTIAVGGAGNQQASAVEEVSVDEIDRVLGEQTGEHAQAEVGSGTVEQAPDEVDQHAAE